MMMCPCRRIQAFPITNGPCKQPCEGKTLISWDHPHGSKKEKMFIYNLSSPEEGFVNEFKYQKNTMDKQPSLNIPNKYKTNTKSVQDVGVRQGGKPPGETNLGCLLYLVCVYLVSSRLAICPWYFSCILHFIDKILFWVGQFIYIYKHFCICCPHEDGPN